MAGAGERAWWRGAVLDGTFQPWSAMLIRT